MAKERTYGGDAQLVNCGKNTVTGVGIAIDVRVKIKKTKPTGPRPTMPNLSSIPGLTSKAAKKIRGRVKKAQERWDTKNKAWKAAQKAAKAAAEKAAKTKAKTIATNHMNQKMGTKQCLDPTCPQLVPDKNKKAEDGVLLTSHVTDTHAYASASSDWTANPLCQKPPAKKAGKAKKLGYYVPKEIEIPVSVAWKTISSETGLKPSQVKSAHTSEEYVWHLKGRSAKRPKAKRRV